MPFEIFTVLLFELGQISAIHILLDRTQLAPQARFGRKGLLEKRHHLGVQLLAALRTIVFVTVLAIIIRRCFHQWREGCRHLGQLLRHGIYIRQGRPHAGPFLAGIHNLLESAAADLIETVVDGTLHAGWPFLHIHPRRHSDRRIVEYCARP